jgi:hypothetical protein
MSYNKNVKLYVQNINKTSRKEYYYTSAQLYLNEIYDINKKISQDGVPIEDMLDEIEYLKKKYNVIKNKDKSNNYLTLLNLTNTAAYKNDAQIYEALYNDTSQNLVITQEQLRAKQLELEVCLRNCGNRRGFELPEIKMVQKVSVKMEYVIYIRDYGMPDDGVFIESILEFIRDTILHMS